MAVSRLQDRTVEFQAVVQQAARRQAQAKGGAGATAQKKRSMMLLGNSNNDSQRQQQAQQQAQPLLSPDGYPDSSAAARPVSSRSEFARRAAEIGRGISSTMAKLERLALCTSSPHLIILHSSFFFLVSSANSSSGKTKEHV